MCLPITLLGELESSSAHALNELYYNQKFPLGNYKQRIELALAQIRHLRIGQGTGVAKEPGQF